MKMSTDYCLRQIKIPLEIYTKIKHYCFAKKIELKIFYAEMLSWFMGYQKKEPNIAYQASLNSGQVLSLWIAEEQIKLVRQLADKAKVSDARVIYTAMMLYLQNAEDLR